MLSIITITYNNFDDLKNTIESVQSNFFVESIIINGGSDSETVKYLYNYDGKVLNEKDEGIADAFNKGIQLSSNNYVMFLNSGDILINKDYLKQAVDILKKREDISFVHSNIKFEDSTGVTLTMKPLQKNLGYGMPYFHPTMIIKKEVFELIGEFDKKYKIAMDYDFVVRIEKQKLKGCYIDTSPPILMNGDGVSSSRELNAIFECYESLKSHRMLNITTFSGFFVRLFLYYGRKLLNIVGGKKLLGLLKKIKHNN